MLTSELDKLLISESSKEEPEKEVEETCDAQHTEITSPDDGSGVKGNAGGKDIETEGFMWYECDIDESSVIDGDPFEFLTEAMYQNVINANNISIAVLADKYKYLRENGEEMIDEAAEAQEEKKKNAVQKWFASAIEKVQSFINTVVAKMLSLQAKFLALFKKAKVASIGDSNLKGIQVSAYTPDEIETWFTNTGVKNAQKGIDSKYPKSDEKTTTTFEKEMKIIKSYGTNIKKVKKLGNDTKKELSRAAKEYAKGTYGNESYAKSANICISTMKDCVSLILKRTNEAAKAITGSLKKEKPAKEAKKTETKEEPKADDKKTATGESASFLDSLDFI